MTILGLALKVMTLALSGARMSDSQTHYWRHSCIWNHWCKQDQILKTKTKMTRQRSKPLLTIPKPRPPDLADLTF